MSTEAQETEAQETVVVIDTTNPFNIGVSYSDFLKNVKGKVTIDSLLKKHKLSDADSKWIKQEVKEFKQKKQ